MAKEEKEKKVKKVQDVEVKEEHDCKCGDGCKCKKSNGFIKVVLGIILAFVIFCGGVVVGGYVLTNDNDVKEPAKEESKEETEKIEEIQIGENYKIELYDENSPSYIDLTLTPEKIEEFVSSTDFLADGEYREALLESNYYLDDFKIAYVVSTMFDDNGGTIYMTFDTLNSEIQKVFSTGIDSANGGSLYMKATEISYTCGSEFCMFNGIVGGGAGFSHPSTKVVSSRKAGENTIYTLKEYDYVFAEENSYAEANGIFLCKSSECPEDMISAYGDKMTTYEMTFDKDNRYVSSKKIN